MIAQHALGEAVVSKQMTHLIKFDVLNRWTSAVQFTAEIQCAPDELPSIKLGLAVQWAVKSGVDLRGVDLSGADLSGVNLRGVDLRGVDLRGVNLRGVDLRGVDLLGVNLLGADLSGVDLRGVDLNGVNLRGVDLSGTNLRGVDLSGTNLRGVDLSGTKGAELAIAMTRILPDGELIGWKKCRENIIVKLRIPADAKRSHAFGRKCRAEFADVLEVFGAEVGISSHDNETEYRVGKRITPDSFDENWMEECSHGVHFFISRIEAENY